MRVCSIVLGGWNNNSRKSFFEVGTGYRSIIPFFFFSWDRKFITVDLHKRMDLKLFKRVLNNLANHREDLEGNWKDFVSADVLRQRFDMVICYKDDPECPVFNTWLRLMRG